MKTVTLTLKEFQLKKLKARAARAELPLETYIIAAASDPLRFAWEEDCKSATGDLKI